MGQVGSVLIFPIVKSSVYKPCLLFHTDVVFLHVFSDEKSMFFYSNSNCTVRQLDMLNAPPEIIWVNTGICLSLTIVILCCICVVSK